MAERPPKRPRFVSSEADDSEGSEDWQPDVADTSAQQNSTMPRGRRGVAVPAPSNRSIRLKVSAPPSKLREVQNSRQNPGRGSKRSAIVEHSDSEEDEDAEGDDDEDEDMDDNDEDDAEGDPEDEDDDMEDEDEAPPPPRIKINAPAAARKPAPEQKLQQRGVKPVEDQEMDDDSDELSEGPDDDDDLEGNEEDAEGDEDDDMLDDDDNNETINSAAIGEDELDSNDDSMDDSTMGTPDPSKLTRRQRGQAENELMALSNEAQKKKFFTAEQLSLRRAEMARRRKDLSEKRNQSEKDETLRRLLQKTAPKRRSRAQMQADAEREEFGTPGADGEGAKARKTHIRTISTLKGSVVCVPEEWNGSPAGVLFDKSQKETKKETAASEARPWRMVEVIEDIPNVRETATA